MPVTASELNPAELVWANFKQKFRRMLYDPELNINAENASFFVDLAMNEVNVNRTKSLGKSMYAQLLKISPKKGYYRTQPIDYDPEDEELESEGELVEVEDHLS